MVFALCVLQKALVSVRVCTQRQLELVHPVLGLTLCMCTHNLCYISQSFTQHWHLPALQRVSLSHSSSHCASLHSRVKLFSDVKAASKKPWLTSISLL